MYGTYETYEGKPAVRFERVYPHARARGWGLFTLPQELAGGLPRTGARDQREGGAGKFTFPEYDVEPMPGRVLELDPPRVFMFLWGEDTLRLELAPEEDGTRLTLVQTLRSQDEAARNAAGWHVCLDKLGGEESDWEPYYAEYERRGLPAGAEIPARR